MKKMMYLLVAAAVIISAIPAKVYAQTPEPLPESGYQFWKYKKQFSIGYSSQALENGSFRESASFGVNLNVLRTIYVHKKPIAELFKVGIDYGLSVDYAKFSSSANDDNYYGYTGPFGYTGSFNAWDIDDDDDSPLNLGRHVVNIGFNVGPSITFRLFKNLRVRPYCYFTPSLSMYINSSNASLSFVPFVTPGIMVGYKFINLGFQYKTGRGSYKDLLTDDDEPGTQIAYETPKIKYRTNSCQFYVSFTF